MAAHSTNATTAQVIVRRLLILNATIP